MMQDIHETRVAGGDVAACIAKYREMYKYVYVYNDSCFKKIFGDTENRALAACFLNAILNLEGPRCISKMDFIDPSVPGGPFVKSVTSDLVAEDPDKNRIVIEVQHKGNSTFKDRLVFYTACHTLQSKVPGDTFSLRHVDYIALQMFDAYSDSDDYKHIVQLKDQHNVLYHGKNVLTIVEIEKFLKGNFGSDDSRLANWLRAIDMVNNEFEGETRNPYLVDLQNAAKLSNFDMDYLLTEAKIMSDHAYELSVERDEAHLEGLAEGRAEGRAEGLAEGRAEGHAEGRAEGRAEGIAEGHAEGLAEAKRSAVIKALKRGKLTVEEIAEDNDLPLDEVLKIQKEH